ncbi:hypothetical protein [Methylobacterium organophilum]|uniref:Uncharacterized protein n=1 Tax=Methylobacterium organophilum TaxID=410 RepID=A0ABQ4TG71_METOR|nr:hypothetical protein [Methylobacterium organophilum]UMY18701.1 hypothetical protein MMB17_05080 [Methylobacterium organophilum]GJE29357.1 hypothetical protein LKMONMHP_4237 [Methylobacterium organophilum]
MKALLPLLGLLAATGAVAQETVRDGRPFTPALSCAAVKRIVAERGHAVLATSPNAYETVHLESGACREEVTAAPAFEPTLDDPNCFAGWRCRQRDNDGTGVR